MSQKLELVQTHFIVFRCMVFRKRVIQQLLIILYNSASPGANKLLIPNGHDKKKTRASIFDDHNSQNDCYLLITFSSFKMYLLSFVIIKMAILKR